MGLFTGINPPTSDILQNIYNRCVDRVEKHYGIEVGISDVVDPNTGDFNGAKILIDHDQDLESALFVLIHLFGHTVQWNTSEEHRRLGLETASKIQEKDLPQIFAYEREATALALTLLHEIGVTELDQWASDWWAADWEYLRRFYQTGEKANVRHLLRAGAERIAPLPIPPFTPQSFDSRWSF